MIRSIFCGEEKTMAIYDQGKFHLFCTCGEILTSDEKIFSCVFCDKEANVLIDSKTSGFEFFAKNITEYENEILFSFDMLRHFSLERELSGRYVCDERKDECVMKYDFQTNSLSINLSSWDDHEFDPIYDPIKKNYAWVQKDNLNEISILSHTLCFRPFIQRIFDRKGILYKDVERILFDKKPLLNALLFLQNPSLQHLPFYHYSDFTLSSAKKVNGMNKSVEIWQALTNHKGKQIRKLVGSSEEKFNTAMLWGKVIKKSDNLAYLLNYMKDPMYPFVTEFEYTDAFIDGFNYLKTFQKNETILVKQIVAANLNSFDSAQYIIDIHSMAQGILRRFPDFQMHYYGNLVEFHDQLTRDSQHANTVLRKIHFTEQERLFEKKLEDGYEFVLPKSTHSLVDIGKTMNICVGSYGKRAADKELTIVTLNKENKPLVCIEVVKGRINQAKLSHNRLPNKNIKEKVIRWASENHLSYTYCSDLA